ncbi:MAG: MOSC domain-containing protein [Chloroflexi bacterium]|nr:MAG: MOSC domain-containing protein [Chloroflexota bacterium]
MAQAGRGLEGDRYSNDPEACDITLVELEALEKLHTEYGVALRPVASRRQVHVRGAKLADLIGRRFRVGEVECEGEEHCEPCQHLVGLLGTQKVLKGLLHTGLRARIVKGGTIRTGDPVELLAAAVV